jgi:predicted ATPase
VPIPIPRSKSHDHCAGELVRDPQNAGRAEEALRAAISVAHQQGARSFGLRAALALAKLVQSMGRPVEAHTVLAPALEGFSLTPEMPEIEEAQALLEDLAVGDKQVSVGPGERA